MSEDGESKRGAGRAFLWGGVSAVVLVLLLFGGAVLFRDSIAVSVASGWLDERGIECPELDPSLSIDLTELTLPETTCTMADGPVASFTLGESTIELSSFEPDAVEVDSLTLDLRDRNVPPASNGWFSALESLAGVQARLRQLMMDGAELSATDWPEMTIGTLTVRRGGTSVARLRNVEVQSEAGSLAVTVESVSFHGHENVQIDTVEATLSPSEGTVSARVEAEVRVLIATVRQRVRAHVVGTALDTAQPRFRLNIGG